MPEQACKDVGADYDVVTTFFVDFTMFLRRMKILENRLPEQGAFHDCVFDVFSSLLRMCGIATRYIQLKRFSKLKYAIDSCGVPNSCAIYSQSHREMGDSLVQRR